jgi:3-(3-hydroxy-phenyl)propionate hydroxylase
MFHGLVADEWRRGKVLLAGDAAHMTPPFMAQGMAQGMRDAQNLAWKLEAVLAGDAGDALLDTYESERRSHVFTTTNNTIELGRVISERDVEVALARDEKLLAEHNGDVPVTMRSNFLPALCDGLVVDGSPGAGEIMPQPFVFNGPTRTLLDDLTGARFRAIVSGAVVPEDRLRLKRALDPVKGSVVVLGDPDNNPDASFAECDGVVSSWLAGLGQTVAIARPDHYVYATAASVQEAVGLVHRLVSKLRPTRTAAGHISY